ncbi:SRPBCC domain-containing protein [Rhizobium sp. LjRoot254]|uniref:SRPBCC domain-containing protein n=1 Tax=Rhizobium sp. LjRoot254 TaxID=3342297 RepID=UPI003ECF5A96
MSIHQETRLSGPPSRVYDILTKSDLFAKMTGGRAADISTEPGGAVSLFGGDIRARNVELVPGKRVVQAWRSQAWPEGVYSIVRFELAADGAGTLLTFDQAGYPDSAHDMLAGGWSKMYWSPMDAMLSAT